MTDQEVNTGFLKRWGFPILAGIAIALPLSEVGECAMTRPIAPGVRGKADGCNGSYAVEGHTPFKKTYWHDYNNDGIIDAKETIYGKVGPFRLIRVKYENLSRKDQSYGRMLRGLSKRSRKR